MTNKEGAKKPVSQPLFSSVNWDDYLYEAVEASLLCPRPGVLLAL